MATDERLNDIEAFVRQHLEAEAALSIAALGEPDDDAYLVVERRAKDFYWPSTTPLGPIETRWATPGGRSPASIIDVSTSVHPAPLFAIGTAGPDAWIALVGSRRDPRGVSISEALSIKLTADGLYIVGRAAVDPFSGDIVFEPAGGEPVAVGLAKQVEILQEPAASKYAEFLRHWGRS